MGKDRRKHGLWQVTRSYEQSRLEEQRNRQLQEEESELLKRQRYVTGLADVVYENDKWEVLTQKHILKAFQESFGDSSVRHVHVRYRRPRRRGAGAWADDSNGQPVLQVEGAVVEFHDAKTAAFVESRRQAVTTDSIARGVRCQDRRELLLQLNSVGDIRKFGGDDGCRYVRLSPNRAPSSQYYHRGGAGQHLLRATRLQVGSYGPDGTTLITELDTYGTPGETKVCFDYQKRHLSVLTQLRGQHLLVNNFRDVHHRLWFDRVQRTLTFTVTQPPRILEPFTGQCAGCCRNDNWNLSGTMYQMAGDFTARHKMGTELSGLCPQCAPDGFLPDREQDWSAWQQGPEIGSELAGADGSLGRCFTYRIKLHPCAIQALEANHNELLRKLSSFALLAPGNVYSWQTSNQQLIEDSSGSAVPQTADGTAAGSKITAAEVVSRKDYEDRHGFCRLNEVLENLYYMVAYNVLVLLSSGVATIWQVSTEEFEHLLRQSTPDMACQALSELALHRTPIKNINKALEQQLLELAALQAEQEAQQQNTVDSSQQYKILRVHVTPTRVKFLPAEVQSGNRVIRHFCSPAAYSSKYAKGLDCLNWLQFGQTDFLRVGFGDEHGDRLLGGTREEVGVASYRRMYYALSKGIVVNGQKFAYLAYSSSQLKTWACWMVADPNQNLPLIEVGSEQIAASLRLWLGDAMETESVPAKCAARLGQGFTTTVDATTMALHEVEEIPDIKGDDCLYRAECVEGHGLVVVNRPTYCFSDGVGRISNELLDAIREDLPYASVDLGPISAIQIRFQGYKGVLSRYSPLRGRAIQLRPSMNKFGSLHPQLEAVSVAAYRPLYLNRQAIIMMNHNGVPEEAFTSKVDVLLSQLHKMTTSVDAALQLLPSLGAIAPGAHDAMIRLLRVAEACDMALDPLMSSCLRAVAQWQVNGLRQKARLLVREGATLMGVMDEYGVLENEEVFVQIQRPHRGKRTCGPPQILTGPVTLSKQPVSHRGDVRTVMAVNPADRPGGQQLIDDYVNVLVFSQKGERPLPHKLAGADLDGDQFQVLWDETLLQPRNSAPSDYNTIQPVRVPKVEVHHLQEHFVNFIRNDNLGSISNWLLAHADREGADSEACDKLAELHSLAVDFAKFGKPAIMHPADRRWLMPYEFEWPHWLEKPERECYHSETVLGQIYDMVVAHPINKHLTAGNGSDTAARGDAAQAGQNGVPVDLNLSSASSCADADSGSHEQLQPLADESSNTQVNGSPADATGICKPAASGVTNVCCNGDDSSTITHANGMVEPARPADKAISSKLGCSTSLESGDVTCSSNRSSSSSDNTGSDCQSAVVCKHLPLENGNVQMEAVESETQSSSQPSWPERLLHLPGIASSYKQHLQQAESHYADYENELIQLMNQSDVTDVGEMLTGCVRWLQTLQHHQQWDRKEHLLRELNAVFSTARRRFLEAVLLLVGIARNKEDLHGISNKALETMVADLCNSNAEANGNSHSSTASARLQLAAAYMLVAHRLLLTQLAQREVASSVVAGALGELFDSYSEAGEWTNGMGHDEDSEGISDVAEDDVQAEHPSSKESPEQLEDWLDLSQKVHEVKLLTRMSFQWVVARELEELAEML